RQDRPLSPGCDALRRPSLRHRKDFVQLSNWFMKKDLKKHDMNKNEYQSLREHVLYLLKGGGAHVKFDEVIAGIPSKLRGQKPAGLPHSPWMLLEHMRIAQRDILGFSRNPKHVSPE